MSTPLDVKLAWSGVRFALDLAHRRIQYWSRVHNRGNPALEQVFTGMAVRACHEMAHRCGKIADLLGDAATATATPAGDITGRIRAANVAETALFDYYDGGYARQTAVEYEALADALGGPEISV